MSINTAHADNGVLIHAGENIILFSDNVNVDISGQDAAHFKGTKNGKIYLTTHRIIFNNRVRSDVLQSISMPFVCLTDVEVEQPVFGPNLIRGKVRAQVDGNFTGEAKFKMTFKSGGAIDFAQCALKAAYIAKKYGNGAAPPPYQPPTGAWHQAPPPAYTASPMGYYGWVPQTQAFPNPPPPNTVYMSDMPPPYPGIVNPGAVPTPNGYAGGVPNYGAPQNGNPAAAGYPGSAPPGYPGAAGGYAGYPGSAPGYPAANGYPGAAPGYPGAAGGYPGAAGGYPGAAGGYPAGYPGAGAPAYPPNAGAGYPSLPGNGGVPPTGNGAYPPGPAYLNGPIGFSGPGNGKEAEAAASAANPNPYYQPPQPDAPPPPEYNEPPPSYNSLNNKKQQ